MEKLVLSRLFIATPAFAGEAPVDSPFAAE